MKEEKIPRLDTFVDSELLLKSIILEIAVLLILYYDENIYESLN